MPKLSDTSYLRPPQISALSSPAKGILWIVGFCLFVGPLEMTKGETPSSISFSKNLMPIFRRSCAGCHHPGKKKGEFDITTFAALQAGGKHGSSFAPGTPDKSRLLEEISGSEPNMPKDGEPLSREEVEMVRKWILEGATDDTPANFAAMTPTEPPVYSSAPIITALAYSPDGSTLAISGYHEVVLHQIEPSRRIARLLGRSPRIESLTYSSDGKLLAVSGGAPAEFGEIQIWDVTKQSLVNSYKVSSDSVFGISFSPDSERVAFGCADKTVRVIRVNDGKELLRLDNHSDWVLGTAFTVDGKRLLSGSRDKAMKLIDSTTGQFIDDINKLLEGVLCFARHPMRDEVAYGGDLGGIRIYRIAENQERTAANNDANLIREFDRQPNPIRSIVYSSDGALLAAGGAFPEISVFRTTDGMRLFGLKGHQGSVFCVRFHPAKPQLAAAGYDGMVRVFDTTSGKLMQNFVPVPIGKETSVASSIP